MIPLAAAIIVVWGLWAHFTALASRGLGPRAAYFWLAVCTASFHLAFAAGARWAWPEAMRGAGTGPGLVPVLGGLTAAGGAVLFVVGQGRYPGSVFVPLTALYPAVSVVLAVGLLRETPTPLQWIGVGLACVSGVLLGCGR
ncbi:MAG: EamA family transporter [Planctomycetes bacterium]|nr:EamA family transporter [Planctomycetota bacterium]